MLNVETRGTTAPQGRQAKTTMRESAKPPSPPSLYTLAREALAVADNDIQAASDVLADRLEDPALRRALSLDAIKMAAGGIIRTTRSSDRAAIEHAERMRRAGVAVLERAAAMSRALMDFPLPHGGLLRDATRKDVETAVAHYEGSAATATRRAAWLKSVAAKVPEGLTVGAALTEADLQAGFIE